MKCETIQRFCVERPDGEWPSDARAHFETCAVCQAFRRRDEAVRRLLAADRVEAPRGFEARLMQAVHTAQAEAPARGVWRELFWPSEGWPVLRYAAALGVLALAVIRFTAVDPLAPAALSVSENETPAVPAPAYALPGRYEGVPERPVTLSSFRYQTMPTNDGPARVQYGPTSSRTVNFEYP